MQCFVALNNVLVTWRSEHKFFSRKRFLLSKALSSAKPQIFELPRNDPKHNYSDSYGETLMVKTDFKYLFRIADNEATKKRLRAMEKDWKTVREKKKLIKGKWFFPLHLKGMKFWFRKKAASSSIDAYLEIFRCNGHFEAKGFDGKKARVVIDVGANEGYYSMKLKKRSPKARIIAVEPIPETVEVLKKNLKANGFNDIEIMSLALGSKTCNAIFEFVPEISEIASKRIYIQPRPWLPKEWIKKVKVKQLTLDSLCAQKNVTQIDILKLDVEASEMDILRGAKKMLPKINKIVIEWHSKKLKKEGTAFLLKNNFKLIKTDKRKEFHCSDSYFVNKRKAKK